MHLQKFVYVAAFCLFSCDEDENPRRAGTFQPSGAPSEDTSSGDNPESGEGVIPSAEEPTATEPERGDSGHELPTGGACVPEPELCNQQDDDCDGQTDEDFDFTSDTRCGSCENNCVRQLRFGHARAVCERRQCQIAECHAGFLDLNDAWQDGCEYACEPNLDTDPPAQEVCNARDDDCNGEVDDGVQWCDLVMGACHRHTGFAGEGFGEELLDVLVGVTSTVWIRFMNCGSEPIPLEFVALGDEVTEELSIASTHLYTCDEAGRRCDGIRVISPGERWAIAVSYEPQDAGFDTARIIVQLRGQEAEEYLLEANGIPNEPPRAVIEFRDPLRERWFEVDPNVPFRFYERPVTVELNGERSWDPEASGLRFHWDAARAPAGQEVVFEPSDREARVSITLEEWGNYEITLIVTDEQGFTSEPVHFPFDFGAGEEGIAVELSWVTPGDPDPNDRGYAAGADLDLHLLHPRGDWFEEPYDCYYSNHNPDWGEPFNEEDNPMFPRDGSRGETNEWIFLPRAESNRVYRVGVHYQDAFNFGASRTTVRIFVRNELAYETDMELTDKGMFWDVVTIAYPSGHITPIDQVSEDPRRRGLP